MTTHLSSTVSRWVDSLTKSMTPAVVLGSSVNGLSFIRSLHRRGVPVLLLDSRTLTAADSRCATFSLIANPDTESTAAANVLESIGKRLGRPAVLMATSDAFVTLLADHADRLRTYYRFLLPDAATVRSIVNKREQYAVAQAAGIALPQMHFPESLDAVKLIAPTMSYPCILKPYVSHSTKQHIGGKKVVLITSAPDLVNQYDALTEKHPDLSLMIQQIVPGDDDQLYGYLALWDSHARERAWLVKRKLRQDVPYGDGSCQITIDEPQVAALGRQLLDAFEYRGLVGVSSDGD